MADNEKCGTADCSFNDFKTSVDAVKMDVMIVKSDVDSIKKTQERFEDKQDQLIDAISNHKAILTEITNFKVNMEKTEERLTRFEMSNKENSVIIFGRLNDLEKGKADKSDVKESRGWLWAILIGVLGFSLSKLLEMFLGKLK